MTIEHLISAIRYQYPLGVTTWSRCANDHCEQPARGGRECEKCLSDALAKRVGVAEAYAFCESTRLAHASACRMLERGKA